MKKIVLDPKLHIEKLFQQRARNDLNSVTLANTLNKDIETLFKGPHKFIFELLQNADDAGESKQPVAVEFILLEDHLIFRHNGQPFTPEDVEKSAITLNNAISIKSKIRIKPDIKALDLKRSSASPIVSVLFRAATNFVLTNRIGQKNPRINPILGRLFRFGPNSLTSSPQSAPILIIINFPPHSYSV